MQKKLQINLILFLSVLLSGCVATNTGPDKDIDPYKNFNEKIFGFNKKLDETIVRPVAQVYDSIVPNSLENKISLFFINLNEVTNVANDILQLEFPLAASDSWRFVINSSIGILGIFDVATSLGFPKNQQYFGKTLYKWGINESPYIVLPILGPSTVTDSVSLVVDNTLLSPFTYVDADTSTRAIMQGVDKMNMRAIALMYDKAAYEAFDPYIFMRNAYLQQRKEILEFNPFEKQNND